MHLKSLTLRGFKSFASATTLRFEPGITAVVGPNGSGKSNVVDAIAWVLGEQGAKALRGGKMEDVIFAGTAGRAPLGRAEVTLTIDNSDNKLPIEFSEVSITRRMFRDGASEYEINGASARLLDIQELLSDSGIGREMHVIVGQGQLDAVLQARPEDRRGFIEEAAGVLKHRKRKEKALRKLDSMTANLNRLSDLTTELRRQLKPLGKQAEIARRAAGVQAELRDSRLRLLADDLVALRTDLLREVADEESIRARRSGVEEGLASARAREGELEQSLAADAPVIAAAQETWYRLSALEERFRGTASLAAERAKHLGAASEPDRQGRDPQALEADAAAVREEEAQLTAELETARTGLTQRLQERGEIEQQLTQAEHALVVAARAQADRREGLARLHGQVNTLRARSGAAAQEIERLTTAAEAVRLRAEQAQTELVQVQSEVGLLDEGEVGLDEQHEQAVAAFEELDARASDLSEAYRTAERDGATWSSRRDALALGLTRKDGAGALLAAGSALPGVLGSVAALLSVEPGYEAALAAALGALADAVAVASAQDVDAALAMLKDTDAGRAGLLIGAAETVQAQNQPCDLPDGVVWALDVVVAPEALRPALAQALHAVAVVSELGMARQLVARHRQVRAVTRDGDVIGQHFATGGSSSAPSAIEIQAAVEEARQNADSAAARHEQLSAELEQVRAARAQAQLAVKSTLAALNESDAQLAAVSEKLAELGQRERAARAETDRLQEAAQEAAASRDRDLAGLVELEERLRVAEAAPQENDDEAIALRDRLREQIGAARQSEMDARLRVRTGEERVRGLAGRADQLLRAAQAERAARERQEQARIARARGAVIARAVHDGASAALAQITQSVVAAQQERDEIQQARVVREGEVLALRGRIRELDGELDQLTSAVHQDELARAQQRMRIEQLEGRAVEEFGVEVGALIAEYGPEQPAPPSAQEMAEYELATERGETVSAPASAPFHRPTLEKRAARAERDLALLGKVNPLALEEFAALEERHQFLAAQLEDLKATRRDLMTVVKEVDERILDVFTSAYHDVAREFEVVFATLFPGGAGRLVLTEPDDMLTTGIEIEARPPGKKVKRLSLLSGGERSLTAVALLVAIFRARPSPFYVMDEIEAALDDVNLGRLIALIEQLRDSSQIIIITHQKRTMEVADALYGVTMRGDGITQVISQRLREADSRANNRPTESSPLPAPEPSPALESVGARS